MDSLRVGVVGASGYSGAVAARLLLAHPWMRLAFATSDKLAGASLRRVFGPHRARDLAFVANGAAVQEAANADAVLLATPAEVSARLVPELLRAAPHLKIVDLSGAFRLATAGEYPEHYGFEHPSPELLEHAFYGLPELFGAPPETTRVVANPGCYPTATLLALLPLIRANLIEARGLIVDAKSGVSGAGVQAKQEYSFVEIAEDVRAYKVLKHQHTPEIRRYLGGASVGLTFTPHLVPLRRGLLATCYGVPKAGVSPEIVEACLKDAYANCPFVEVVPVGEATMKSVAGTARARVGATANSDVVVAVGVIDNLLKGAASQALQNLARWCGRDDTAGLTALLPLMP